MNALVTSIVFVIIITGSYSSVLQQNNLIAQNVIKPSKLISYSKEFSRMFKLASHQKVVFYASYEIPFNKE